MARKKKRDEWAEKNLASLWNHRFKNAMVHKSDYTRRWQDYWDAYYGDYFRMEKKPDYKSDSVSNYIFSTVETIRPLMVDNDPKFMAMPKSPDGMKFSHDLQNALTSEWEREKASLKLYKQLIPTLVTGTSIFFVPWNKEKKNAEMIPVNVFNFFPDPLATSMEDADYVIYADYYNVERLRRMFPERAEELSGSSVNYSELVYENDKNARVDNQVLIIEVWTKDFEEEANEGKKAKDKEVYPNGRVITIAPELGLVLKDVENPYDVQYENNKFPFVVMKDYDVPGKFWGEGEVAQLLSPQKQMNELNNAIVDNAKTTANMPWIVDKNAGIGYGKITGRPGLIIRKNPGSEVKREAPPAMPLYVINAVETYKQDMEQISGIFNTVKGNSETGVYTAQGVLALQEAGQLRIRIKTKVMEEALGEMARMFYSRMKQFWKEDRWLAVTTEGEQDMKKFSKEVLKYDYDIMVSAGSTMPVNRSAMLDLMIRLAQTQMPDGQALVDREAVVEYLPPEVKSALLERMKDNQGTLTEIIQSIQELGQQIQMVQQETQESLGQMDQQIQEVAQTSEENDQQHVQMIEEIAKALENLQERILHTQQTHANMEEEKRKEQEFDKIRSEAYNRGYSDAGSVGFDDPDELGVDMMMGLEDLEGMEDETGIPDDLLEVIEDMSDEELSVFLEQNPQIAALFGDDITGTTPPSMGIPEEEF